MDSDVHKKFDNAIEAYKFLASDNKIESQPQETKEKEKESFKEKLKNKQNMQKIMIEKLLEKNK